MFDLPATRPAPAASLPGYFQHCLRNAAQQRALSASDDALSYLGQLMARFARSDQLFEYERGYYGVRPLALLYADAHETDSEQHRCLLLQRLGDLSLFLGALFPERYARRGIRRDYFVGMGTGAYGYLSDRALANRGVFGELTARFAPLLELLAETGSPRDRREPYPAPGLRLA
jgi:hypothetical protein